MWTAVLSALGVGFLKATLLVRSVVELYDWLPVFLETQNTEFVDMLTWFGQPAAPWG